MISNIHHTSFTVSQMERSIKFYRDLFGMKVVWDSLQAGVPYKGPLADKVTGCPGTEQRIVYLSMGDSLLELVQYTPTGKPLSDNKASDTGSCHVCFTTDNIQELYGKLSNKGVSLHCIPQNLGHAWVMYFRDPDGIILEAREELHKRW
jgi:catechol 2,3-dioxygenase-like lactoylglutathione lyase family enzyme